MLVHDVVKLEEAEWGVWWRGGELQRCDVVVVVVDLEQQHHIGIYIFNNSSHHSCFGTQKIEEEQTRITTHSTKCTAKKYAQHEIQVHQWIPIYLCGNQLIQLHEPMYRL
jgi:hypothetical protein